MPRNHCCDPFETHKKSIFKDLCNPPKLAIRSRVVTANSLVCQNCFKSLSQQNEEEEQTAQQEVEDEGTLVLKWIFGTNRVI